MPNWPARLIGEFDAADQRARALAAGLSREQLNWQPAPGQWSVGQCLEHLCVSSDVYAKPIADSLPGHPEAIVEEITPGWFGGWFVRTYIEPSEKTRKAPAPRKIKPGNEVDLSVVDRFVRGNDQNRELVRRSAQLNVNRIRFRNPFLALVRFTVGTGFEIISKHESRHLLQAERVKSLASFPKA